MVGVCYIGQLYTVITYVSSGNMQPSCC